MKLLNILALVVEVFMEDNNCQRCSVSYKTKDMRYLLLLIIILNSGWSALAQGSRQFYVGEVNPYTESTYLKKTEEIYGISYRTDIEQSPYKIHIKLDANTSTLYARTYFELYLDTVFKINVTGYKLDENGNEKAWKSTTILPAIADSIFKVLVGNGIFSLPMLTKQQIMERFNPMTLSNGILEKAFKVSINDGIHYTLTYKIDKYYGQLLFDNPKTYAEIHLDNAIFKRLAGIVHAFDSIEME